MSSQYLHLGLIPLHERTVACLLSFFIVTFNPQCLQLYVFVKKIVLSLFLALLEGPALPLIEEPDEDFPPPPPPLPNGDSGK